MPLCTEKQARAVVNVFMLDAGYKKSHYNILGYVPLRKRSVVVASFSGLPRLQFLIACSMLCFCFKK